MINNLKLSRKTAFFLTVTVSLLLMVCITSTAAANSKTTTFSIQPGWPGVTVKTKIATLILQSLGYSTKTVQLPSSIIYQGIKTGDVQVSFGAWMPTHKSMLQPLINKGEVVKLTTNMKGATQGLAVPEYTWKAGIHTVQDLVANGDRFHHKINAISAGAGMTQAFERAVKKNYEGLGSWTVQPSSVAAMMAEVERATQKHDPIVFHGWKPHWMDVKYNIRFLKDKPGSKIARVKVNVWTVVPRSWPKKHPQVARFLRQLHISVKAQSHWIYNFSYKKMSAKAVAQKWISQHMNTVKKWLAGVKAADGHSATDVVSTKF